MLKRSIELTPRIMLRTVAGNAIYLDVDKLPDPIIAKVFEAGAKVILTNAFNGGGKDATEAERLAAMQKKMDAWSRGEFAVVERGESAFTGMREAWLDEFREATGATIKQADAFLADKVHSALGKDAKATFSNYLDVTAKELVKAGQFESDADAREALEAHYAKLANDAAERRAKAKAKLEAPKLDLSAFKKA